MRRDDSCGALDREPSGAATRTYGNYAFDETAIVFYLFVKHDIFISIHQLLLFAKYKVNKGNTKYMRIKLFIYLDY